MKNIDLYLKEKTTQNMTNNRNLNIVHHGLKPIEEISGIPQMKEHVFVESYASTNKCLICGCWQDEANDVSCQDKHESSDFVKKLEESQCPNCGAKPGYCEHSWF